MSDINKKYVDYAGLQEYDSQIKGVISTDFVGATSSVNGAAGRVPAPESGDENKFLRGDGTWSSVTGGVTGVKGNAETDYRNGNVNITAANIGLGNVDNTSDANKPISTAMQNELNALHTVSSLNYIPCTAVKIYSVIEGVTIINYQDGTYLLNGTAESRISIDLVSGNILTGASYSSANVAMPLVDPTLTEQDRRFAISLGNDNVSGIKVCVDGYHGMPLQHVRGWYVSGSDGIQICDPHPQQSQPELIRWLSYGLYIEQGSIFDNDIIMPACWSVYLSDTHPGKGGNLTNSALFDYIKQHMKTTFIGTRAQWTALSYPYKCFYQVVILTDD